MLLKPVYPVFEYVYNYDYITTVLCENLDKPQLECNGKCHLMKEMGKASEKENPISNSKKLAQAPIEILFFQNLDYKFIPYFESINTACFYTFYQNNYTYLLISGVFEPPAILA